MIPTFDWQLHGMASKVYERSDEYKDVTILLDLGDLGLVRIRLNEMQAESLMQQIQIRLGE